jgi:beta-glucosidase
LSTVATYDANFGQTIAPIAPYGTVDAAYQAVESFLAAGNTALTAAQKAAISVTNVVHQTPGDSTTPVVSYRVSMTGDYPTSYAMRLGDLQRSAGRVLNTAMQSAQFAQLATINDVSGVTAVPYDSKLTLVDWMTGSNGPVVKKQTGNGPAITLSTTTAPPASGWYRGPVTVTIATDSNAASYLDVDSGVLANYTGPVTVSGDGVHEIRALAVGVDGAFSKLQELTVKIDTTAPAVSVSSNRNGTVALKAKDPLSGVASIQYAIGKGGWHTYTKTVAVPHAPAYVRYRATDKAGNVTASHTVLVLGKLTLSKPVVKGKAVIGNKLLVAVAHHTSRAHLSYVWKRSGKAIAGAHSSHYTLTKADKGKRLTVTVTEKKVHYSTATSTSARTAVVKVRG